MVRPGTGHLRHVLKFLHTIGAIGMMGSMACLLVLLGVTPRLTGDPAALAGYALMRRAMGAIATWIFFPSLGLTLGAGLLAIAFNRGFHNAGWAWLKLATGLVIFEGAFVSVLGPFQQEAERSARAVAGQVDPSTLGASLGTERGTLWVVLAVSMANVVLGVWRPRIGRRLD